MVLIKLWVYLLVCENISYIVWIIIDLLFENWNDQIKTQRSDYVIQNSKTKKPLYDIFSMCCLLNLKSTVHYRKTIDKRTLNGDTNTKLHCDFHGKQWNARLPL